ncbi:MAG: hypothetical protein ACWGPN_11325 [Gammaproteobacteria bacterium]
MRIVLPVSVAFNLLLSAGMVMARVDLTRSQRHELPASGSSAGKATAATAPGSLLELRRILADAGLTEESIKPLIFGWVTADASWLDPVGSDDSNASGPSWEAGYAPAEPDPPETLENEERARRALLQLYGPGAAAEPAFAALFRHSGACFPFDRFEAAQHPLRFSIDR